MTKLERATHICLIAASCVAAGLLLEKHFYSVSPQDAERPELIGASVRLPDVKWKPAALTVVLQISSHCRFCLTSMPFYRRVAAARKEHQQSVSFVVISPEAVPIIQSHLEGQHLTVDKVLRARVMGLTLMATPTLLLVDGEGIVQQAFVGELNAHAEKKILSIVKNGRI